MTSHSSQNPSSASVRTDNRIKCQRAHQLFAHIPAEALEYFYYGPTNYILSHLVDHAAPNDPDNSTFLSVEPQYGFQTISVGGPKVQQDDLANLSTYGHYDEDETRSSFGFSPDKIISSTPVMDRNRSSVDTSWELEAIDFNLGPAFKVFDGPKMRTGGTPTVTPQNLGEDVFDSGKSGEMEDPQQGTKEFQPGPDNIPDAADDAFDNWWKIRGGIVVDSSESAQPMLQISKQQLKLILRDHYRFPDFVILLNHLNKDKTAVSFKEPVAILENKRNRHAAGPGIDEHVREQVKNQVQYCFSQYIGVHNIPSISLIGHEWIWTDWHRSMESTTEKGSSLLEQDTERGCIVYNKVFQEKWSNLLGLHKMTCSAFDY